MPRKGENIYKRKDGRWEGRYIKSRTPAGKANYGYVYAKTYREVKAKLVNQISFASNSTTANQKVPTVCFECIAMEWFQTIRPQVKESSSNKYWNLLNSYVLPAFGVKPLCDITHDFIEEQCNLFLTEGGLKGNGLSAKTVVCHSLKVFPEIACPMVKPPVGIKVCPVVYTDLFNGSFINSMFPQHFFLGFFPDTPLPVLTSVVICHSFFLQSI